MQLRALSALLAVWFAFAQTKEPYLGEGKQATEAEISDPTAVVVDRSMLYIAEFRGAIRRVDLKTGIIGTVPVKDRQLISGLAVDGGGNLIAADFIADRVYRIDPRTGAVATIAGGGGEKFHFSGDGDLATRAELSEPNSVLMDAAGNLYIADLGNRRIRRVDAKTGIIATVAGSGKQGSGGDGGPALDAEFDFPNSVAIDRVGNLFIAQSGYKMDSHRVRRVDAKTGIITTVAGGPNAFLKGDGGLANMAVLSPSSLVFDRSDNLYIVDPFLDLVRVIDAKTQKIATAAGSTKGVQRRWRTGHKCTAR